MKNLNPSWVSRRIKHILLAANVLLFSLLAGIAVAHNLDASAVYTYFDEDTRDLLDARIADENWAPPQPLLQVGDEIGLIIKALPDNGTDTGVGGYTTFYVPNGVQIIDVAFVIPGDNDADGIKGYDRIPGHGQAAMPSVGSGGDSTVSLVGYSRGPNILDVTSDMVDARNANLGTLPGVYGDNGIFFSTAPETAFGSYPGSKDPVTGVITNSIKNNSGDIVGHRTSRGTPLNAWDAWQMQAYGISGTTNPDYVGSPIIDSNGRGYAPWGLASAVAGPESGYAWQFDLEEYRACTLDKAAGSLTPAPECIDAATDDMGPWNRIKYSGSTIGDDPPGSNPPDQPYVSGEGTNIGHDLSAAPLPATVSQTDSTSPNAIRWAFGQLTLLGPEFAWVKLKITDSSEILDDTGCPIWWVDTFGGDAGGDSGGKDHIWRYYDPTSVILNGCVAIGKIAEREAVQAGDYFEYEINYYNAGDNDMYNVALRDTLPSGVNFISSIPAQDSGPNPLVWQLGNVLRGESFRAVVTVEASGNGALSNELCIEGTNADGEAYDSCTNEETPSGSIPIMVQNKSVNPTSIAPGGQVQYTIKIDNIGSGPSGNPYVISEYLPVGFSFVSLDSVIVNNADLTGSTTVDATDLNKPVFTVPAGVDAQDSLVLTFTAVVSLANEPEYYCNSFTGSQGGINHTTGALACVNVGGGKIGGNIFRDWLDTGSQDFGDEGVEAMTVELLDCGADGNCATTDDNGATKTVQTDADGNYLFEGLAPAAAGTTYEITVLDGTGSEVAGYDQTVAPTGVPAGGTPADCRTGGTGTACPGGSNIFTLTITEAADESLDNDFGYHPLGSGVIGDLVFEDKDNDGIFNNADVPINGVTLNLYEDSDGNGVIDLGSGDLLLATTTNASGIYSFTGVPEGLGYVVQVNQMDAALATHFPESWIISTGAYRWPVSDLSGTYNDADFGFWGVASSTLTGFVYQDENADSSIDVGSDVLVEGVKVWLCAGAVAVCDDTVLGHVETTTDGNGQYAFTDLAGDATYTVGVDEGSNFIEDGYNPSTDNTQVYIDLGQNVDNINFPFTQLLSKTADNNSPSVGDDITYTISPTYVGTEALTNVVVTDPVPTGTTFVSAAQGGFLGTGAAAPLTLSATGDTRLDQNDNDRNYGITDPLQTNGRAGQSERVLIEFDVSSIPSTATITSAQLVLHHNAGKIDGEDVDAHRVTSDWIEGTLSNATGDASWDNGLAATPWTTPGGDYDATVLDSNAIAAQNTDYSWDIASAAQSWVDGSAGNFGILLKGTTETGGDRAQLWASRDDVTNPPELQITYTNGNLNEVTWNLGSTSAAVDGINPGGTDTFSTPAQIDTIRNANSTDALPDVYAVGDNVYSVFVNGSGRTYFTYSTDGGDNWIPDPPTVPLPLINGENKDSNPAIAVHTDGTIHVVYVNESRNVYYTRSINNGTSWSTPAEIDSAAGDSGDNLPRIALDSSGNPYVVFNSGGRNTYLNKSADAGLTWAGAAILPTINAETQDRNVDIAIDSSNNLHVVIDNESKNVFYLKSIDGGANWINLAEIDRVAGDSADKLPRIDVDGLNPYVVFNNNGASTYFNKSTDGGGTWAGASILPLINAELKDTLSDISVDSDGNIHVVIENEGGKNVFYTSSVDDGATWETPREIDTAAGDSTDRTPVVATSGGKVHVVFGQNGTNVFYTGADLLPINENELSATPSLLTGPSTITVVQTLTSDKAVANVSPGTPTATGTNGAAITTGSCVYAPVGTQNITAGGSVAFTWTCPVTVGTEAGTVNLSVDASGDAGATTFASATSNTAIATPPLTFVVEVTSVQAAIENTAGIYDSTGTIGTSGDPSDSNTVTTPVLSNIGDTIWEDWNQDGIKDANEPGILGVTVELDNGNCVVGGASAPACPTTTTDSNGNYSFSGVEPGTNTVLVTDTGNVLTGYTPTYDLDGIGTANEASFTVTAGVSRDDVDFGYLPKGTASVGDQLFVDVGNDGGAYIPGTDMPLSGVTVEIYRDMDNSGDYSTGDVLYDSTTTDGGGRYGFSDLAAGDWVVKVVTTTVPGGYSSSVTDAELGTTLTTVADLTLDFPFTATGAASEQLIKSVVNTTTTQDPGDFAVVGNTLTYTLEPNYTGNALLTNVAVTDDVPAGSTYVAASANAGGTESSGTVTWNLGTNTPGVPGATTGYGDASAELTWNTFLGSTTYDYTHDMVVDSSGNTYVVGHGNPGWGSPVRNYTSGSDGYVAKLDSSGNLLWNTFLGGSGSDSVQGVALDSSGNVYVVGDSDSTWGSPLQGYSGGPDAFVAKLDGSTGSLTWNTFLGHAGADNGNAIAVDGTGNVYVAGYSASTWGSPVTSHHGSSDGFAAKLTSSGSLSWNTFIGGGSADVATGIAVDGSGNVYIAGYSSGTWGSPARSYSGGTDGFAAKLASSGSLTWNTFLGGSGTDRSTAVAVDGSGNAYVSGNSAATWGSPTDAFSGTDDGFAAKLTTGGSLTWNNFVGGSGADYANDLALDGDANVYLSGYSTATWGSPLLAYSGGSDAFTAMLSNSGNRIWNAFLGSSSTDLGNAMAVASSNTVYVAGQSNAPGWGSPVRPFSVGTQTYYHDSFVAQIDIGTVTSSISQGSDDAEQQGNFNGNQPANTVYTVSSDIELVDDLEPTSSGSQTVGLRFNNITVPNGAVVTNAYITFRAVAPDSPNTNNNNASLTIYGENVDSASTFVQTTTVQNGISGRPKVASTVAWSIPSTEPWSTGSDYDTPNIATIAQDIVNRAGWISGNSMVYIFDGSGSRSSESLENAGTNPAQLTIQYTTTGTTTSLSVDRSLVTSPDTVTVTMTLTSEDSDTNVTPAAMVGKDTVDSVNGSQAACGSPSPVSSSITAGTPLTFTWTCTLTTGTNGLPGNIVFGVGNTTAGDTTTYASAQSNSTIVSPPLTFQVLVAGGVDPILNSGHIADTSVTLNSDSNEVATALSASVGDRVWNDFDGDGFQDPGELGMSGVTVRIFDSGGTLLDTAVTDVNGAYRFFGLSGGEQYTVVADVATVPAGSVATTDTTHTTTTLTAGEQYDLADFGFRPPNTGVTASSIGDTVYLDADEDGTQDAGEAGIAGVTVYMYSDENADGVINGTDSVMGTTTTDANGNYLFDGLYADDYIVQIVAPAGAEGVGNVGTPGPATGSIGDRVFLDADEDGLEDLGESGISGVDVTLTQYVNVITGLVDLDNDADVSGSPSTNDNGLVDGVRIIKGEIDVNNDGIIDTDDDVTTWSCGGCIFTGVTIVDGVVTSGDGSLTKSAGSTTTDADGNYNFDQLLAGNYTVEVDGADVPAGLTDTTGTSLDVTLADGENYDVADFGYKDTAGNAVIGDRLWVDADGDGVQDEGEIGLGGIEVRLCEVSDCSSGSVVTTTTAADGSYLFTNVAAGTFFVEVNGGSDPTGYDQTGNPDETGTCSSCNNWSQLTVAAGDIVTDVDFGYQPTTATNGKIGDTVWNDLDGDGTVNGAETGIAGVTINLIDSTTGDVIATTTTDANGNYSFTGVPDGTTYKVEVTDIDGRLNRLQLVSGADPTANISISSGDPLHEDADFGYQVLPATVTQSVYLAESTDILTVDFPLNWAGQIGDVSWYDKNGDSVQDGPANPAECDNSDPTHECGAPNTTIQVRVDSNNNGYLDGNDQLLEVQVTGDGTTDVDGDGNIDPAGYYNFDNLPPGNYYIIAGKQEVPAPASSPNAGLIGTMIATTRTFVPVVLASGEVRTDVDFGFKEAAILGGKLWHDINANGLIDSGEALPDNTGSPVGVTITLTGIDINGIAVTETTTTDARGNYEFVVDSGNYTISYSSGDPNIPSTLTTETTPLSISVEVIAGEDRSGLNFGVDNSGAIGDLIWNDADGDGIQDAGEAGIQGVTVQLYASDGTTLIATQATDATGNYEFIGLEDSGYIVKVIESNFLPGGPLEGFNNTGDPDVEPPNTTPGTCTTCDNQGSTTISGGGTDYDIDFGYMPPEVTYSVGGNIWDDNSGTSGTAGDGIKDTGEPDLSGVTVIVEVDTNNDGTVDQTYSVVTDSNGDYNVSGIPSGSKVTVTVDTSTLSSGAYVNTGDPDVTPPNGTPGDCASCNSTTVVTTLTSDVADLNFGYDEDLGSIAGTVCDNGGGNGDCGETGEVGVEGVTVFLTGAGPDGLLGTSDDIVQATTTDANGDYSFTDLGPGPYTISISNPDGKANLADADGGNANSIYVDLAVGDDETNQDFELTGASGAVGDLVWFDMDRDGVYDIGEPGLVNATVTLWDPGIDGQPGGGDDILIATETTSMNGKYLFTDVPAGDYFVTVDESTIESGLTETAGTVNPGTVFTLAGGEVNLDQDFGYLGDPTKSVIGNFVWSDKNGDGVQDAGEPGIGGVTIDLLNESGNVIATTITAEDGSYYFVGIDPGRYRIDVTDTIGVLDDYDLTSGPQSSPDPTDIIDVGAGEAYLAADFGYNNAALNDITDRVWYDADRDGFQDPGETGIVGVTIDLYEDTDGDGSFTKTMISGKVDINGDGTIDANDDTGPGEFWNGYVIIEGVLYLSDGTTLLTGTTLKGVPVINGVLDMDGDGTAGAGDNGEMVDEPIIATAVTNDLGDFAFTGLEDGDYVMSVSDNSGVLTGDQGTTTSAQNYERPVTVAGFDVNGVNFGYVGLGPIGDTIFSDADGNGLQDPGEPGIAGVEVKLYADDGDGIFEPGTDDVLVGTAITDSAGQYAFNDLVAATYFTTVDETQSALSSYTSTTTDQRPATTDSTEIGAQLSTGTTKINVIAGSLDVNGDGIISVDDDDPVGVHGVEVIDGDLDLNGDGTVDGNDDGWWNGTEVIDGQLNLDDSDSVINASDAGNVTVSQSSFLNADFGFRNNSLADVTGTVFNDINLNAVFEDSEPRFENVTVALVSPGIVDGYIDIDGDGVITAADNGNYGGYTVTAGVISAADNTVIFGMKVTGGRLDVNGDGTVDTADDRAPAVVATMETNETGVYEFEDVVEGSYSVVVVDELDVLNGYTLTSGLDEIQIAVPATGTVDDVNFGYARNTGTASIGDTVWLDANGNGEFESNESGLASVELTLYVDRNSTGTPNTTVNVIGGALDMNFDTVIDASDYGLWYGLNVYAGGIDVNGDGVVDSNDNGLVGDIYTVSNGLIVGALSSVDAPWDTTVTDSTGTYLFSGLPADDYRVVVDSGTTPSGLTASNGTSSSVVTLSDGETYLDADFPYVPDSGKAVLGDTVWFDYNGNGIQDSGETGIGGVKVIISDDEGKTYEVITEPDGSWLAVVDETSTPTSPSEYIVTVDRITLSGSVINTPTNMGGGDTYILPVAEGDVRLNLDFGYDAGVSVNIGDTVYLDTNGNGTQDSGEEGISGVSLVLSSIGIIEGKVDVNGDGVIDSNDTGTDVYGGYDVSNGVLAAAAIGNFINGYKAISDGAGGAVLDINGNNTADTADNLAVQVISSTGTDDEGSYLFSGLLPGDYRVDVTSVPGLVLTTNNDPTGIITLDGLTAPTSTYLLADFGYKPAANTAVIGDRIWSDGDGNGIQDAGEIGIGGITVNLYDGATLIDSTVTASDGSYLFTGVPAAADTTYTVSVDTSGVLSGYTQTGEGDPGTPCSPCLSEMDVTVGPTSGLYVFTAADFGYEGNTTKADGSIEGTIYKDDNGNSNQDTGENSLDMITIHLVDDSGAILATTTTDANGDYSFSGLPAGVYSIQVTDEQIEIEDKLATEVPVLPITIVCSTSCTDVTDVDFGYDKATLAAGSIGDTVYFDSDGDGTQDGGEVGITGVTLDLYTVEIIGGYVDLNGDGFISSADTGLVSNGEGYGGYDIVNGKLPAAANNTVVNGYNVISDDLGGYGLDIDMSSTIDASDNLASVRLGTKTTGPLGKYEFAGLEAGDYRVVVTDTNGVLTDLTATEVAPVKTLTCSGDVCDEIVTADFGYQSTNGDNGTIGGTIWHDTIQPPDVTDAGTLEPGEPGIQGVTVELWLDNNNDGTIDPGTDNLVRTTTTDINGDYLFLGMPPGNYIVNVVDNKEVIGGLIDMNGDGIIDGFDGGTYGGYDVYGGAIDYNDNGGIDAGDNGFVYGVEVIAGGLDINDDDGVTAADNGYVGDGVLGGLKSVIGPNPDNDSNGHVDPYAVTLALGEVDTSVDFAYEAQTPFALSGVVFEDAGTSKFTWDDPAGTGDDAYLPGATVRLYAVVDGVELLVGTTITDGTGAYSFTDLADTVTYRVRVDTSATDASSWEQTVDPDTVEAQCTNCDSMTEVTIAGANVTDLNFGYWNGDIVTTPVTLSYFEATAGEEEGDVFFNWSTVTEAGNVGFDLYVVSDDDVWIRVNMDFIPALEGGPTQMRDYNYFANGVPEGAFYIVDIDIMGVETEHGPFKLNKSYGRKDLKPNPIDIKAIQKEHDAKQKAHKERKKGKMKDKLKKQKDKLKKNGRWSAATHAEPNWATRLAGGVLSLLVGSAQAAELPVTDTGLIQFHVTQSGVHRVSYKQLADAGLDLAGVDDDVIALTNMGEPVPVNVVNGSGKKKAFGIGWYIEFIGEKLETLYSKTNVYSLYLDEDKAERMLVDNSRPSKKNKAEPWYLETTRVEVEASWDFASPGGDPWYMTRMLAYKAAYTDDFEIDLQTYAGNVAPVTLGVDMWGVTSWPEEQDDHHVQLQFNGTEVADEWFDGLLNYPLRLELPSGTPVEEGINILTITLPYDTGYLFDLVNLDAYEATYPRRFEAMAGLSLDFNASGDLFEVKDLANNQILVYRTDVDGSVFIMSRAKTSEQSDGSFSVQFPGITAEANYLVLTEDAIQSPALVPAPDEIDITSQEGKYLIIAHPDFIGINADEAEGEDELYSLEDLKLAREQRGFSVVLADLEQIYAQFSHGVVDAQAIKDYITYAYQNMGTEMVLLVGGDTFDYHGYLGAGPVSFVPSLYAQTDQFIYFAPVDPKYADINDDNLPDLAIGRFPVRSSVELSQMVHKTLVWETGERNTGENAYGQTALFIADGYDAAQDYDFKQDAEIMRALAPSEWQAGITQSYLDDIDVPLARTTIIDTINAGVALTSFVGHSGYSLWTFDNLFSAEDAIGLTNDLRPTVVTQWGCWNTYYVSNNENTMAHEFLLNGEQGAAAVLGASTLTEAPHERQLAKLVYDRLFLPGVDLGTAILAAKQQYAEDAPEHLDVILGWTLLGDPALMMTEQ